MRLEWPAAPVGARVLARQALEVAAKDLRVEVRSGEALPVIVPFGAAALLLLPIAVDADLPLLRQAGWGMYWVVVLLFGTLVTVRGTAVDAPAQHDLLALLGVDPAARFGGQTLASALLLVAFQVLLAPVAVALYDPGLAGWWWLGPTTPLVAVGLAALGTLAGTLTGGLPARGTLAPLLVLPLSVPLLLAGTQVLAGAAAGRSPVLWLLLLLAVDLVALAAGVLAAEAVGESSR
jgi:heme exporter protein B